MRRKRVVVGVTLLVLSFVALPSAFAYPIAYCGSICFTAPRCRSECTEMITTCEEWWANCVNSISASTLGNQTPGVNLFDPSKEATSEAACSLNSQQRSPG